MFPLLGVVLGEETSSALLTSPHMIVWGLSIWTFLPLSLFMRGIALARIAETIVQQRARLTDDTLAAGPALPRSGY